MKKILAFDIGGTKIAYAIINEKGTFLNEVIKVSTPKTASGIYELLKTFFILHLIKKICYILYSFSCIFSLTVTYTILGKQIERRNEK